MTINNVTSFLNYFTSFLALALAGLVGFNWTTYFDAPTSLKIVGGLNLLGLLVKSWVATAQQMAKTITPEKS